PLPPETELSRQMTTSTTSIDIMGLQAAYANLHTDQERDYFMQRYHDVISSFGGKTSYDADNRPLRSEERRVGKECSCRWSPYQITKTTIYSKKNTNLVTLGNTDKDNMS